MPTLEISGLHRSVSKNQRRNILTILSGGLENGYRFYLKETKETTPWNQVGEQIKAINKEALGRIKNIMPEFAKDVEKAFSDHKKRLDAIMKRPVTETKPKSTEGKEKKPGPNLAAAIKQQLAASEARLLTMAPGAKIDYAKQTASNTREHLNYLRQQIKKADMFISKCDSIINAIRKPRGEKESKQEADNSYSRETAINTKLQLNKESEIAKTAQKMLTTLERIGKGNNNTGLSLSNLG